MHIVEGVAFAAFNETRAQQVNIGDEPKTKVVIQPDQYRPRTNTDAGIDIVDI